MFPVEVIRLRTICTQHSIYQLCPVSMIPATDARLFPDLSINGAREALRTNSVAFPDHLRGVWLPVEMAGRFRGRLVISFRHSDQRASGYDLAPEATTSTVVDWDACAEFTSECKSELEAAARNAFTWGVDHLDTQEQVCEAIQVECVRYLTEGNMGAVTGPDGRTYLVEIVARLVEPEE